MYSTLGHYTMENMGAMLRFEMPYRKNWLNIVLYALMLAALTYLGVLLAIGFVRNKGIDSIEASSNSTLIFNGLFQAIIFLDIIVEGAWQLAGREVVEIDGDHIGLRHQIFGIGFTKKYAANQVDRVYSAYQENNLIYYLTTRKQSSVYSFRLGNVAFDHGKNLFGRAKSARFGSILDEQEAKQIVALIWQRFPQYKPKEKGEISVG